MTFMKVKVISIQVKCGKLPKTLEIYFYQDVLHVSVLKCRSKTLMGSQRYPLGIRIFWLSRYRGVCHHDNQHFAYRLPLKFYPFTNIYILRSHSFFIITITYLVSKYYYKRSFFPQNIFDLHEIQGYLNLGQI